MPVKKYKPTTPTLRYKTVADFSDLTDKRPEKSLLSKKTRTGGRNAQGIMTSRHRGGGHKKRYRIVDFVRGKHGLTARVAALEYDPNRSARLALLIYPDGEKAYVLAPDKLAVGDQIVSGAGSAVKIGNALPVKEIPLGTDIHNLELKVGKGGQVARSAGNHCTIMSKEGDMVQVRMPSGEIRLIHGNCQAVIGQVGNIEHESIVIGSAGRSRWMGRRPHVRGVAMNPVDHPMGGGEGKTSGGGHPVSPWGKKAKGKKTRHPKKATSRYIIKRFSDK
ncbi:MAG: 50S ribosomal protein L2 [Fibrobacterota bacterium]